MTEFDSTDHEQKSTRSGNGNQDTSGGLGHDKNRNILDPEDPKETQNNNASGNPTWNYNPKPEAGEISSISSNTPGGFWGQPVDHTNTQQPSQRGNFGFYSQKAVHPSFG